MLILILAIAFIVLLFLVFRHPAPAVDRLIFFLLLVGVSIGLFFLFAQRILDYDPDPDRLRIARWITNEKIVDFTQFVPGLPADLDLIQLLDVDEDEDEERKEEWIVFYRYDEIEKGDNTVGPFGAAIYDVDKCRPQAVLSFELVPENYDYLSLDLPRVSDDPDKSDVIVDNIIEHEEEYGPECLHQGEGPDRPELIVFGRTNGVRTDLNIFRGTGDELTCIERQQWVDFYGHKDFPCSLTYENIGSWRANYKVELKGNKVVTYDRAPFERSVLVVKRVYMPDKASGSYFKSTAEAGATRVLRDPVEVSIDFGPGIPKDTQQVYYPEKTVLAFFLQLGSDLDEAMENVCEVKGRRSSYDPDNFGLAMPQRNLEKILVCEIRYDPDIVAERNHRPQSVYVRVVEVPKGGTGNCNDAHLLRCDVIAEVDPSAQPYGCQWCLSGCVEE